MVRDISSVSEDSLRLNWPLLKDNIRIWTVSNIDDLEKVICSKKDVIIVNLNLYEELLKSNLDIFKRCNVIINEGRINGKKPREAYIG